MYIYGYYEIRKAFLDHNNVAYLKVRSTKYMGEI